MKNLLFCLLAPLLLVLPAPARAQQTGVGFIRFVNAIGLEGNLEIKMEGTPVRPKGFAPGDMTGGVGLTEGSHSFAFNHPACTGLEKNVKVEPNSTCTMVLVYEEKLDKDGEVKERVVKGKELKAIDRDRKSSVTLYSFSRQPVLTLKAFINNKMPGQDVVLKSGEASVIPMPASGDLLLGIGQTKILSMTLEDPGHYAAVIYDDPAAMGTLRVVYFLNETFQIGG